MLASITPLGERGRHSTYWITVTAFVLGSTIAALAAGALVGLAGQLVLPAMTVNARLAILAVAGVLALLLDAGPLRVPGPRRQVDERWLESYRSWVYGLGFGMQLGLGITTIVASAATYVALLAAFLSAGAARGALVVGCFGALRGLSLLAAARVRSPAALRALHRAIDRYRAVSTRLGVALLGLLVIAALAGTLS